LCAQQDQRSVVGCPVEILRVAYAKNIFVMGKMTALMDFQFQTNSAVVSDDI